MGLLVYKLQTLSTDLPITCGRLGVRRTMDQTYLDGLTRTNQRFRWDVGARLVHWLVRPHTMGHAAILAEADVLP